MRALVIALTGLLLYLLCAAQVGPANQRFHVAPGSNVTVVTNAFNRVTISASGGLAALNQTQFDSTSTNIAAGALITNLVTKATLGTTNWPARFYGSNLTGSAYFNENNTLYIQNPTPNNLPVIKFPSSDWGLYDATSGGGNGMFFSNPGFTAEAKFDASGIGISHGTMFWWSQYPNSQTANTAIRRNAANTIEVDSGTTGLANRGTILAAKYTGRAGTSTSAFNAGGLIVVDTTQTGNVGTGEDVLQTNFIGANVLVANGDVLTFKCVGTYSASANNKRIRAYVDATSILDTTALPIVGPFAWVLTGSITRTGATTQKVDTTLVVNNATTLAPMGEYTATTATLSSGFGLKVTGEATDNDDIVKQVWQVRFEPGP